MVPNIPKTTTIKYYFYCFYLKAKANGECNTTRISSYQSLSAFVWRSITQARRLPHDEMTTFLLTINNRSRLDPPLSQDYFGNSVHTVPVIRQVGELSEKGLGWAAWQLHEALANYGDEQVRQWFREWLKSPLTWKADHRLSISSVLVNDCTKFNTSDGNEFGILGKPIGFNFGDRNHMSDGYVYLYSGSGTTNVVHIEVCLLPQTERPPIGQRIHGNHLLINM